MLPAFLIVHTIAYSGDVQTLSAFRYPSMLACEQFKSELQIKPSEPTLKVERIYCTEQRPAWWRS